MTDLLEAAFPTTNASNLKIRDKVLLRVLSGPRKGASLIIPDRGSFTIGYSIGNDIVIRDPVMKGNRALLNFDDMGATLRVMEGSAKLVGLELASGHAAILPRLVPFQIGSSQVAFGPIDTEQWNTCESLATHQAQHTSSQARTTAVPSQASASREAASVTKIDEAIEDDEQNPSLVDNPSKRFKLPLWARRALIPVLMVFACLLFLLVRYSSGPNSDSDTSNIQQSKARTLSLQAVLKKEGFESLQIIAPAGEQHIVRGFVESQLDRTRLANAIRSTGIDMRMDVTTGEQLSTATETVFRANGIDAIAKYDKNGSVVVTTHGIDQQKIDRIAARAKSDVPGLKSLIVRNTAPPKKIEPLRAEDPNKRIVRVSYGAGGSILTADGSRYFAGSFMASGHRIVEITDRDVVLERDGVISRVVF
jgi:type III secretion protein D